MRDGQLRKYTLLATSSLAVMSGSTLGPALPSIHAAFADQPAADFWVRLLLTIPALAIVLSAGILGVIIDRFGRRRVLLVSVVLFVLSGSSGLYLDTLPALIAGRAFLGMAVAGTLTCSSTLIGDYFAGEKRSQIIGAQAAAMAFGGVAFVGLGGLLADFHWRGPFVIYLTPLLLLPAVFISIGEPGVHHESKASGKTKTSESLSVKRTGTVCGLAFLSMLVFYMLPVNLAFYLSSLLGQGGTEAGIALGCSTFVSAFSSAYYPRIKRQLSFPIVVAMTYGGIGLGYLVLSISGSFWMVLVAMTIAGAGMGFNLPNANLWVMSITPVSYRGRALGTLTTALYLGQFLCPVVFQPLIHRVGVGLTFGYAGGAMVIAALVLTLMRKLVQWEHPTT